MTIVNKGINEKRGVFEGYGSDHPIPSIDSEEGRQQNRYIDVWVTQKQLGISINSTRLQLSKVVISLF